MLVRLFLCCFILSGCSFLPFNKGAPFHIKAVIEGEIKGQKIHCEKILDLTNGKWGVMCNIGNDMDVKYRVRPMSSDLAQIEFMVGKSKEGKEKVILAPRLLVKKSQSIRMVSSTNNANIVVVAERAQ